MAMGFEKAWNIFLKGWSALCFGRSVCFNLNITQRATGMAAMGSRKGYRHPNMDSNPPKAGYVAVPTPRMLELYPMASVLSLFW